MRPWTIRCPGCGREYAIPLLAIVRGRWPWRCEECRTQPAAWDLGNGKRNDA